MKKRIYFSKEYTSNIRGILAILVVVHHLYLYTGMFANTFLAYLLGLSGELAVAMFFFFTGYGLMISAKKDNYINYFFRNRFLPIYIFYIVLVVLYGFWTVFLKGSISLQLIVKSLTFGKTVVVNGWYLQATLILYLLYLFVFKIFKNPKKQIFVYSIAIVLYCGLCILLDLSKVWYQSVFCIVLGMLYCYNKDRIDGILEKYSCSIFVIANALFIIFGIYRIVPQLVSIVYFPFWICAVISSAYFLCDTLIINNSFFSLCGKYSLEIYVTHGFFLNLNKYYTMDVPTYVVIVILGTVIMSAFMKVVYTKIVDIVSMLK